MIFAKALLSEQRVRMRESSLITCPELQITVHNYQLLYFNFSLRILKIFIEAETVDHSWDINFQMYKTRLEKIPYILTDFSSIEGTETTKPYLLVQCQYHFFAENTDHNDLTQNSTY